jgi:hypothetical protein
MQSSYPASFDREVGCTDAEWRMWLPAALGDRTGAIAQGSARVDIDGGRLELSWEPMPPRVIALVRLPRLAVRFRFENVDDDRRNAFMRRFDLHMQRGGG